jgi:ribosomal protein S18 acetylase RimI-like enzyme
VLPRHRRQGVGAALLSFMRTLAEQQGMREVFVFTTRSNRAAVEFYTATGGLAENGDDLLFVYPVGC